VLWIGREKDKQKVYENETRESLLIVTNKTNNYRRGQEEMYTRTVEVHDDDVPTPDAAKKSTTMMCRRPTRPRRDIYAYELLKSTTMTCRRGQEDMVSVYGTTFLGMAVNTKSRL